MSDFLWFVIIGVLFVLLGLVFMLLGWHIWKEQKMTLIISHHCDKVSDENKKAYFYPTLLLYTKENIYNLNDIKINELNEFKYVQMLNKIEECQKYFNKNNC